MNFTTKISISKSNSQINYSSKIISIGSCFASTMGEKFEYFKFQNTVNPFGIIFNPISIENLINRAVNQIEFTENDIFFYNESWHCFEVHSVLSNTSSQLFLEKLNRILHYFRTQTIEATHYIITYGTSWIYRNKTSNTIVANCHKVAQNQFNKEILSVEVIEKSIQNTIDLVKKVNPNCQFIFTISPVRHIKDGFVENQLSKAHLITSLQSAISNLQTANYFPSYEILLDELRDYRYYTEDMLHPNKIAIDYIWERFCESTISEDSFPIMEEISTIQKSLLHKPFNPNSESHLKFIAKLNKKMSTLVSKYPNIQF